MTEPAQPAPNTPTPPIEERIAALVGQRDDASAKSAQLAQNNQALQQQIDALTKQVQTFAQQSALPSDGDLVTQLLREAEAPPRSEASPKKTTLSADDIARVVKASVEASLQPIQERIAEDQQTQQLRSAQARSFNVAAGQMPDLLERESELSQLTERLFTERADLANLPDAPLLLATVAKGILADAKKVDKVVDARKRQAAVNRPPSQIDLFSQDTDRAQEASELKKQLMEEGATKGLSHAGIADLFRTKLTEIVEGQEQ